jgi:hypothetical protein
MEASSHALYDSAHSGAPRFVSMAELIKKLFHWRDSGPDGLYQVRKKPQYADRHQKYDGGMDKNAENADENFKYKGNDIPKPQVQNAQGSPEIQYKTGAFPHSRPPRGNCGNAA